MAYIDISFRELERTAVSGASYAVFDAADRQLAGGPMPAAEIHLHDVGPIVRVVIMPPATLPPADALGQSLTILMDFAWDANAPCPPLSDDRLTSPGFQGHMIELANRASSDSQRREYKGLIWRESDGRITYEHLPAENYEIFTNCEVKWNFPPSNGRALEGITHVHGYAIGESTPCGGGGKYVPDKWGGGSPEDWDVLSQIAAAAGRPVPSYIVDLNLSIFRLDAGVEPAQRPRNPNKWKRGTDGCYRGYR